MKTETEIKERIEYLEKQLTEITFMVMEAQEENKSNEIRRALLSGRSSINAEIHILKWVLNEKK